MMHDSIKIDPLIDIVEYAGEIILRIYKAEKEEWSIKFKQDESPLTIADKASNEYICTKLNEYHPGIPIISEENKEVQYEIRSTYEYFWLIDPLDGTKEFIKRNGEFTINMALIHQKKPVLGIVYAPYIGSIFWAIDKMGAFKKKGSNKIIERIYVNSFGLTDKNLRIVASRSHLNNDTEEFINKFNNPVKVSMGSALKFMLIAEGKAEIYPRLSPTMEWDTAASQIIVEEAGGIILDYNLKEPLIYNKESLVNGSFVAYGNAKSVS